MCLTLSRSKSKTFVFLVLSDNYKLLCSQCSGCTCAFHQHQEVPLLFLMASHIKSVELRVFEQLGKEKNLTDLFQGSTGRRKKKSAASIHPFHLSVHLLLFVLCSIIKVLNICFVSFPEQGNAYITCMPGPVRRWNHPVPLCIGGVTL